MRRGKNRSMASFYDGVEALSISSESIDGTSVDPAKPSAVESAANSGHGFSVQTAANGTHWVDQEAMSSLNNHLEKVKRQIREMTASAERFQRVLRDTRDDPSEISTREQSAMQSLAASLLGTRANQRRLVVVLDDSE